MAPIPQGESKIENIILVDNFPRGTALPVL